MFILFFPHLVTAYILISTSCILFQWKREESSYICAYTFIKSPQKYREQRLETLIIRQEHLIRNAKRKVYDKTGK